MTVDSLSQLLADPNHIGMSPALAEKLGLNDQDVVRGRLMAEGGDAGAHLGVYLLATYVVDDTDWFGDGEIYWWSIPAHLDGNGRARVNPLGGLPNGAPPHKVGSLEWMTNLTLAKPPLLAVISPDESIQQCVLRLAIYDDDGAAANVPTALSEGIEVFAGLSRDALPDANQVILPVRNAIWKSLRADQDDILIDQDVILRHGEASRYGAGMIGSVITARARAYYFVKDERRTQQFGPVALHKGQLETVKFETPMVPGGRLALFARGADVGCTAFGDLDTDRPFQNRVIESRQEASLKDGFNVQGSGPAKFIAYYTPPR